MLAACLLAALATNDDPAGAVDEIDRPLVLRVHSLAGLVEYRGRNDSTLSLLPYGVGANLLMREPSEESGPPVLGNSDVVDLVREVVEPSVWEELPGTRLDVRGENGLVVVAPQEVQDAVADFLARLVQGLVPTEVLEVRVLPADGVGPEGPIDVAEADRRIGARARRRASAALCGRTVVAAEDADVETIVYDYEIEVAQGATIADPIVTTVKSGLEVIARSARVEGGTLVSLVARASDPVASAGDRRVAAKSLVNAKPVMSERVAAGVFQHPQLAFAAFAGTVFLPEGKAVWIPVTVATHAGPVSFCLDLRVSGRLTPLRTSIEPTRPGGAESLRIDLASRAAADLPGVVLRRIPRRTFDGGWTDSEGSEPIWAALHEQEDDGTLVELVNDVAAEALEAGHGSVRYAGNALLTWLPRPFADRVGGALAPLQRFDASLTLRGQVTLGGAERARFSAPLVVGRPAAVWAGVQGTRLLDWDVDVANEAQACNPQPEAWLDGLALRIEAVRSATGELLLDVNGKVCLLDGPPKPVELQDESRLTIDRVRARTLFVDELRTLPSQGGTVVFGGDLALVLELGPAGR